MKLFVILLGFFCAIAKGDTRIAGGEAVQINAYPYATSLMTNGGSGDFAYACGGSILTANAILSAASCFFTNGIADEASWWRARVGTALSDQGGTVHLIRRIDAHPDFSPTIFDNDLAVLRTTVNMALQWGQVEAARIVGAAHQLATQQPVWAIGWGATTAGGALSSQLHHVQFWVVDQNTCASRYAVQGFTVTANMVCTGWLDVGVRGQCPGDAGSPMVEQGAVVGVHTRAQGCGDDWFPGVNTRLAPYSRWVVATAVSA